MTESPTEEETVLLKDCSEDVGPIMYAREWRRAYLPSVRAVDFNATALASMGRKSHVPVSSLGPWIIKPVVFLSTERNSFWS